MAQPITVNFYPAHGLDSYTGYGRMELGIARGLQGAHINILLYPDLTYPMLMVNSSFQLLSVPHVDGTRLWAFNMIETNKVAPAWVEKINQQCERLLVPCPPMIDIYKQSGITIPVDWIPLGVDLFDVPEVEETLPDHWELPRGETFNFLAYSYGGARKGGDIAIKAFLNGFEGDFRYRLIIKAREGYEKSWLARSMDHPQIDVIGGRQSEAEWRALQRRAHCFLFPSRGEGWGLPPRELTMAGVPTIATQWLGMWDVDQWGIPLRYTRMTLCEFDDYQANAKDANWTEPDPEHLTEQMHWVVNNYLAALKIAYDGRHYLLNNFGWLQIGGQIKQLLEKHG